MVVLFEGENAGSVIREQIICILREQMLDVLKGSNVWTGIREQMLGLLYRRKNQVY
jgi:hypothetical protein